MIDFINISSFKVCLSSVYKWDHDCFITFVADRSRFLFASYFVWFISVAAYVRLSFFFCKSKYVIPVQFETEIEHARLCSLYILLYTFAWFIFVFYSFFNSFFFFLVLLFLMFSHLYHPLILSQGRGYSTYRSVSFFFIFISTFRTYERGLIRNEDSHIHIYKLYSQTITRVHILLLYLFSIRPH